MKDFKLKECGGDTVTVRNQWVRRQSERSPPDSVLLDIGIRRADAEQWNCASLTPRMARRVAAALLKAADEAEAKRGGR